MDALATELVDICRSLFDRGLTPGTTGNVSVRTGDGLLITPTGSCMGRLTPTDLATVGPDGASASDPMPSKELNLHLAVYARIPSAHAVVHLHSLYATALSCLADLDPDHALGHLTGYHALKVGRLGLVPYHRPGSAELAAAVDAGLASANSLLLANHGSLVAGTTLETAADAAEQIEQSAHIYFLVGDRATSPIVPERKPG